MTNGHSSTLKLMRVVYEQRLRRQSPPSDKERLFVLATPWFIDHRPSLWNFLDINERPRGVK